MFCPLEIPPVFPSPIPNWLYSIRNPTHYHNIGPRLQILLLRLSSYLYAIGKSVWKKWKKRYFVLVQVSQYTFAMCTYKEKKSEPSEMMQLDAYTVDYIEAASGK